METLEKIHQGWDHQTAAESEDAESAQQLPTSVVLPSVIVYLINKIIF